MTREDYLEVGRAANGKLLWRTWFLHLIATLFRIQIKIGGRPYGANFNRAINCAADREPDRSHSGGGSMV